MEKSGYVSELIADGTDEAEERRQPAGIGECCSSVPGGERGGRSGGIPGQCCTVQ